MRGFPEWAKLPADVRAVLSGSEDFLTGRTIGMLRFCSAPVIRDVLGALGVDLPPDDVNYEIDLWPSTRHEPASLSEELGQEICEPDAMLMSPRAAVLIEAKFIGSRLGYYVSQLGREWLIASARSAERGWNGVRLLTITQDVVDPRMPPWGADGSLVGAAEQISQFVADMASRGHAVPTLSASEVGATVRWTSWAGLAHAVVEARSRADGPDARILEDVAAVLDTFGCVRFAGWRFDRLPPMPECPPGALLAGEVGLFSFAGLPPIPAPPANPVLST